MTVATAADLLARMLALREEWVVLDGAKRMRIRRPAEAQLAQWRYGVDVERVAGCVVGWDGFTEADLLGASQGSDDPAPFSADLCAEVLRDHVVWVSKVSDAIVDAITRHMDAREDERKNSAPS